MTIYINGVAVGGIGDMTKAVYDPNDDGAVKDSDKLESSSKATVQDHTPKAHTLGSHSTKAHTELTGVSANQHHAQSHTLGSHSTKAHTELTGVSANQHHAQSHTLGSHSTKAHTELTGVTAAQHHAKYTNAEADARVTALAILKSAAVGNNLEQFADTERSSVPESYVKVKEVILPRAGAYRIKFDLKSNQAGIVAFAKVYKNDVAFGTEQTNNTTTYVTKSEDLSGWSAADRCSVYYHGQGGIAVYLRNFRIYVAVLIDGVVLTD